MSVHVTIVEGPLGTEAVESAAGAGAVVVFEGIVRVREGEGEVEALEYEAYRPMAERMLEDIGKELSARNGLVGMWVEHSVGMVRAGARSFRLRVAAVHRKEALGAMDEFIERMKRDVPIWKRPVWKRGDEAP